jgi:transposase-like protein
VGQEIPWEDRERAQELYCVDGHTFDQVAAETGIAASTLKRWSGEYDWPGKRAEIRQARADIRANTIRLRAQLIKNCLDAGAPEAMDVFAVAKMEEVAAKAAELAAKGQALQAGRAAPLREIRTEADAVAALDEAVALRLNAMLADPGQVSLTGLREIKSVLDLLRDMRATVSSTEKDGQAGDRGLSAATADKLRDLLGGQL